MHQGCDQPRRAGVSSTQEGCRTVVDGPFTEARSREEARDWTERFPNPMGEGAQTEIEARKN